MNKRKTIEAEHEAEAKMNALAKALGYAKAIFAVDTWHNGKYVMQFMTNDKDSFLKCEILHCCKDKAYLVAMEDLLFKNSSWKNAVQTIERKCRYGYCIDVFCDAFNGFIHVLKENETVDEALIRLDLESIEE